MEISKLTIQELKAMCYDQIKLLNQTQVNINILEAEIAKKEKEHDNNPSQNPNTSKDIQ